MQLNLNPGDEILLPNYICDVILHPIKQVNLKYKFYNIDDEFKPNWSQIRKLVSPKTKCLMMVHYFGQPQNIELFKSFCSENNLFLIEDNAHGFGGKYKGKKLGTFGDIGISSPRKFYNIFSGGVLHLNNADICPLKIKDKFKKYPVGFFEFLRKKSTLFPGNLRPIIIRLLKNRPKYEIIDAFREKIIEDYLIDSISLLSIKKSNLDLKIKRNRSIFLKHEDFAIKNNLQPVFNSLQPDSCPWLFPAYTKDHDESIYWFNWGWRNNVKIFSWPSLPEEILQKNPSSAERWRRLVCFEI